MLVRLTTEAGDLIAEPQLFERLPEAGDRVAWAGTTYEVQPGVLFVRDGETLTGAPRWTHCLTVRAVGPAPKESPKPKAKAPPKPQVVRG
jgi:hypothetical protein